MTRVTKQGMAGRQFDTPGIKLDFLSFLQALFQCMSATIHKSNQHSFFFAFIFGSPVSNSSSIVPKPKISRTLSERAGWG